MILDLNIRILQWSVVTLKNYIFIFRFPFIYLIY